MTNIFNNIFLNLLTIFVLLLNLSCANKPRMSELSSELIIERDFANNKLIVQLKKGNISVDSIELQDVNFKVDSVVKLSPDNWMYFYSQRCGSNCRLRKQILLRANGNELVSVFKCYYDYSYNFTGEYASDNLVPDKELNKRMKISVDFGKNEETILVSSEQVINYKELNQHKKNSLTVLTYNHDKGIYSNAIIEFKDEFTVSGPDGEVTVNINDMIPVIKIDKLQFIYYKDNWYEFLEEEKHLLLF